MQSKVKAAQAVLKDVRALFAQQSAVVREEKAKAKAAAKPKPKASASKTKK